MGLVRAVVAVEFLGSLAITGWGLVSLNWTLAAAGWASILIASVLVLLLGIYDRLAPSLPVIPHEDYTVEVSARDRTSDHRLICPVCGRANAQNAASCADCRANFVLA